MACGGGVERSDLPDCLDIVARSKEVSMRMVPDRVRSSAQ